MEVQPEYTLETVDHLGLVSSLCQEVGLAEKINRRIHPDGSERVVKTGQSIMALILNGLGYSQRRLYLTSQFFQGKPIDKLIDSELEADDLTESTLGKALDDIADYGETRLFSEVACEMALEKGLLAGPYRIDTTSISTQGEYATDEGDQVVNITPGYSKDHRPDLNQVVLSVIMKGPAELPIHMNALDGNSSDKSSFLNSIEQVEALKKELDLKNTSRWIADSALYTKRNIVQLSQVEWVTRVPETLSEVKKIVEQADNQWAWKDFGNGYRATALESTYGGISQRWLLVFSEQSYKREKETFLKKVEKEKHLAEKQAWHLSCQEFGCEDDARAQAMKLLDELKYHNAEISVEAEMGYATKGRPKSGEEQQIKCYRIKVSIRQSEESVSKGLNAKGRFILGTNILDKDILSDEQMLAEYKEQQQPERGFRFIKSPEFLVRSVYLKSARRIQALLMVMTLTLYIYNLGQYQIRQALAENNEHLPDQKKKPTQKPTLRWIFELMQGIGMITITVVDGKMQRFFAKMTELQKKIINLFGESAQMMYELIPKSGT